MPLNFSQIAGLSSAIVKGSQTAVNSASLLSTVQTLGSAASQIDADINDGLSNLNTGLQSAFAGTLADADYQTLISADSENEANLASLSESIISALAVEAPSPASVVAPASLEAPVEAPEIEATPVLDPVAEVAAQ